MEKGGKEDLSPVVHVDNVVVSPPYKLHLSYIEYNETDPTTTTPTLTSMDVTSLTDNYSPTTSTNQSSSGVISDFVILF